MAHAVYMDQGVSKNFERMRALGNMRVIIKLVEVSRFTLLLFEVKNTLFCTIEFYDHISLFLLLHQEVEVQDQSGVILIFSK